MWRRRRGRDLLRPYELLVLDAIQQRLDPLAGVLLGRQIESIELVQRHLDGREVNLYPTRSRPQRHDPAMAFPNRTEELRLASVTFSGPNGKGKADVYVVLGHLFQVVFKPIPKQFGDARAFQVGSVTVHADPMTPGADVGVNQRLADIDPELRAELEEMWADETADRVGLASPSETYRIELSDGGYVVLAQLDDTSFLVAPIDPPRPGVRRFWPDGELLREYPDVRSAIDDR